MVAKKVRLGLRFNQKSAKLDSSNLVGSFSGHKSFKASKVLQRAAHRVTVSRVFNSQLLASVKTDALGYSAGQDAKTVTVLKELLSSDRPNSELIDLTYDSRKLVNEVKTIIKKEKSERVLREKKEKEEQAQVPFSMSHFCMHAREACLHPFTLAVRLLPGVHTRLASTPARHSPAAFMRIITCSHPFACACRWQAKKNKMMQRRKHRSNSLAIPGTLGADVAAAFQGIDDESCKMVLASACFRLRCCCFSLFSPPSLTCSTRHHVPLRLGWLPASHGIVVPDARSWLGGPKQTTTTKNPCQRP